MEVRGPELAEVVWCIWEFIVDAGGETIGQVHYYKKSMHTPNQLNPVFACLGLGKHRFGLQKVLHIHPLFSHLRSRDSNTYIRELLGNYLR